MEQRDYILREIEKVGAVIRAIRQKLFGESNEPAISMKAPARELREIIMAEAYIDLDKLTDPDPAAADDYLSGVKGFDTGNIELLAATVADLGFTGASTGCRLLLEKALLLYEVCNRRDRTYSFVREERMNRIREALNAGMQT